VKSFEKYPGMKELSRIPKTQDPVLPTAFIKRDDRYSYFSPIATVGTPHFITS
jgi:hypothetical protein